MSSRGLADLWSEIWIRKEQGCVLQGRITRGQVCKIVSLKQSDFFSSIDPQLRVEMKTDRIHKLLEIFLKRIAKKRVQRIQKKLKDLSQTNCNCDSDEQIESGKRIETSICVFDSLRCVVSYIRPLILPSIWLITHERG